MNKVTKQELQELIDHVIEDISYREGGTFKMPNPNTDDSPDWPFDEEAANRVTRTLLKLTKLIR